MTEVLLMRLEVKNETQDGLGRDSSEPGTEPGLALLCLHVHLRYLT
jgi:hypothetical protein